MLKPIVIAFLALAAAYLVNQLPSFNKVIQGLIGRVPILRKLREPIQNGLLVLACLVVLAILTALVTSQGSGQLIVARPGDNRLVVSELQLPSSLPGSTSSTVPDSDQGIDYLRRVGLLYRGTVFSQRAYLECELQGTSCEESIFYVVDDPSPDLEVLGGEYDLDYETGTGDIACYRHFHDGETLCLRTMNATVRLVARLQAGSGTGDFSWRFSEDDEFRKRDLERVIAAINRLEPSGRRATIQPYTVHYAPDGTDISISVAGAQPGEYVDVEVGSGPGSNSGGICPELSPGPCTLTAALGGQVGDRGTVQVRFHWIPCAMLSGRGVQKDIEGTYPIWIKGRTSGFLAVAAFQVVIRETERSHVIC